MTDQTPNSLMKVEAPITSKYGTAQILIFTISAILELSIAQFIINNRYNTNIVGGGIFAFVLVLVIVFLCARSDYSLFLTKRILVFRTRKTLKKDEIYKYKTTSRKAKQFTGLESVDDEGRLKFSKFKSFERGTCNRGLCYVVTPADSRDLESFYAGIEKLYSAIPHDTLHKTIVAQSKALTNLCETYEQKLQVKNLPIPVRSGLMAKKKYFENIKDRVGWMYVIFLGIGYIIEDEKAISKIDEVRANYSKFLHITGIKVTPVTDANEYALLYSQMFHMTDLRGIDR